MTRLESALKRAADMLGALGKRLGLTRERIRQIEARALSRLRHPSNDTGARDLL